MYMKPPAVNGKITELTPDSKTPPVNIPKTVPARAPMAVNNCTNIAFLLENPDCTKMA
jgi:hypothetical protein